MPAIEHDSTNPSAEQIQLETFLFGPGYVLPARAYCLWSILTSHSVLLLLTEASEYKWYWYSQISVYLPVKSQSICQSNLSQFASQISVNLPGCAFARVPRVPSIRVIEFEFSREVEFQQLTFSLRVRVALHIFTSLQVHLAEQRVP